jgi:hypothetical protein
MTFLAVKKEVIGSNCFPLSTPLACESMLHRRGEKVGFKLYPTTKRKGITFYTKKL